MFSETYGKENIEMVVKVANDYKALCADLRCEASLDDFITSLERNLNAQTNTGEDGIPQSDSFGKKINNIVKEHKSWVHRLSSKDGEEVLDSINKWEAQVIKEGCAIDLATALKGSTNIKEAEFKSLYLQHCERLNIKPDYLEFKKALVYLKDLN